jgi:DNA polymerase-1
MPPLLYLLDGHALAYRTYYALSGAGGGGRWLTSQGEPTAGVYGFASVLLRILDQERPDYLAVAFDTGKTFRDEIYPEYKATREKMPDDLRPQIERIRELVDAFNIPRLEMEGFEADDVLGSAARWAAEQGLGVKIITGDRDLLQLVEDRIIVNLPAGRSLSEARDYRREDVKEYVGVLPEQVVDYKALVGDKSDNIPGIYGVGEKTAVSLLETYGSLDEIYLHLDELTKSQRRKMETGREDAYLSRKLAQIVTDLSVSFDLDTARVDNFSPRSVENLFRQLEFRSLMKRLTALAEAMGVDNLKSEDGQLVLFPGDKPPPETVRDEADLLVHVVQTGEDLQALVERLNEADRIAFDTETTSTDQMQAELVGISLAVEPGEGYYIPVGHKMDASPQLPVDTVLEALRGPMTDPRIPKAGHNLKYDFVLLARQGLRVTPLGFDTMIAEWLRDPTSRNLGLKNLAWVRLDERMTDIEELIGSGRNQRTMAEVPVRESAAYAAADAEVVLRLIPQLEEALERCEARALFQEMEMPLIEVLADMEMAGISLDVAFLQEMSQELEVELAAIEARVHEAVGEPFNLNSPQQLSQALFDRLALEPPDRTRRTSSGYYSTAANVLDAMRDVHPVVDLVLHYRELSKLKSTYVDALQLQVNPETGRVHTSYNQTGSVTGRIASSDPNLQNIPIRTEIGRRVRHAFVAGPGNLLLAVDYSQVELRIVAHIANDRAMLQAFQSGQDIHTTTAAAIYQVPIDSVTAEQRRHAKAINFGLIYGMSPYGLTRATDLTLAEAEDFVGAYFEQFPGVERYLQETRQLAAEQGFVETLLGRRRYFPRLKNQTNYNVRSREEREAVNAPIQGTAADIMKMAMIRVHQGLNEAGLNSQILLQVHDELVLECPEQEVERAAELVKVTMENAYDIRAPLQADTREGSNWGSMTRLNV